jgi:hypothetical protein
MDLGPTILWAHNTHNYKFKFYVIMSMTVNAFQNFLLKSADQIHNICWKGSIFGTYFLNVVISELGCE